MKDQLRRLYAQNHNPVAFLDESYELVEEQTFYILACAVVKPEFLIQTRVALASYYGGEAMHAAPMFDRREIESLRGGIELAAKQHDGMDLVVQVPVESTDPRGQRARRQCLEFLAPLVHEDEGTTLFVLDALNNSRAVREDRFTFSDLRRSGLLSRDVTELHVRPSVEPVLALPDLLAWSYRQRVIGKDATWFSPLEGATRVRQIGA